MFFPVPVRVEDDRPFHAIPAANAALIAINVVMFLLFDPAGLMVGPGSGLLTVVTYGFAHAHLWHLVANMWMLLIFGTPVNRRLGNGWYLTVYLGTILCLGLFARLFIGGYLLGASGAIFAVMAVFVLLMPSKRVEIYYLALFPLTVIMGIVQPPKHWLFWLIRWDQFSMRAVWGVVLVPLIELWGLFGSGWNWTNVGHLFGLICGVAAALMLPASITMRRERTAWEC